jgi:hypothetical protein
VKSNKESDMKKTVCMVVDFDARTISRAGGGAKSGGKRRAKRRGKGKKSRKGKKRGKLTGAAKKAFLARMARGRKAAGAR